MSYFILFMKFLFILINTILIQTIFRIDLLLQKYINFIVFSSSSLFKPDLPQYKMKCIENLGFGIVDKIFLRFESKWWLPDWNGIRLLWTVEDREVLEKHILEYM